MAFAFHRLLTSNGIANNDYEFYCELVDIESEFAQNLDVPDKIWTSFNIFSSVGSDPILKVHLFEIISNIYCVVI